MAKNKKKPVNKKKAIKKKAVKKKVVKKIKAANKKKVVTKKAVKKATPQKALVKKAVPKKAIAKKPVMAWDGFVTPLDDRVLIELAEAELRTAGGLYIPNTVSDVSGNLQGRVVSVGRGRRDKKGRIHPMDLKVGDKVVFPQYAGSKIKIQDQDLMILRESDVLGVVG